MKTVAFLAVIGLVASVALAVPVVKLDFQQNATNGNTTAGGYTAFGFTSAGTVNVLGPMTVGNVTLTALKDSGDGTPVLTPRKKTFSGGAYPLLEDFIRVEMNTSSTPPAYGAEYLGSNGPYDATYPGNNQGGTAGREDEAPVMRITVTGLQPWEYYNVVTSNVNAQAKECYFNLRPAAGTGTTGPTIASGYSNVTWVPTQTGTWYYKPVNTANPVGGDSAFQTTGQYLVPASGTLNIELAYDLTRAPTWSDREIALNGLVVDLAPEPATMALLVLGGLGFLRRRR
jgi:hypothetical protein